MDIKKELAILLKKHLQQDVEPLLEIPPGPSLGDYALPCFTLAKALKKSPQEIAQSLAKEMHATFIERAEANGPYLNIFISRSLITQSVLNEILSKKE